MKKIGRLSAAAFSFASIANNSLAVSTGEDAGSGIGDIIPFALGALLIICVLFIGYKMDKYSENAPIIKKEKFLKAKKNQKGKKAKGVDEISEAEEAEIYAEENKADIPYEADENEYYENDNNFDYHSGLNDETEYEEDDISLFSAENDQDSSFDDIDDNITYDVEQPAQTFYEEPAQTTESTPTQSFDSTMIFDSNELNKVEDEFEYTDAVELDDKIDSLDDLDNFDNIEVLQSSKVEEQDAESFMNELNKYKEEAEDEDFGGFTTKSVAREEKKEVEVAPVEEKHVKRYTKKKNISSETPSGQMDIGFLNQMEQNLRRNQEERMKKAGEAVEEPAEQPKKRGRKPKKQEN